MKLSTLLLILCFSHHFNDVSSGVFKKVNLTITKNCRRWSTITVNNTNYKSSTFLNVVQIDSVSGVAKQQKLTIMNKDLVWNYFKSINNSIIVITRKRCNTNAQWINLLPETLKSQIKNNSDAYFILCKEDCVGKFPILAQPKKVRTNNGQTITYGPVEITIGEEATTTVTSAVTISPSSPSPIKHKEAKTTNQNTFIVVIVVLVTIILITAVVLFYWKRKRIFNWLKHSKDTSTRRSSQVLSSTTSRCQGEHNYDGLTGDTPRIYETLPRIENENPYPDNIYASADNKYYCAADINSNATSNAHLGSSIENSEQHDAYTTSSLDRGVENQAYSMHSKNSVQNFPKNRMTSRESLPALGIKSSTKNGNKSTAIAQSSIYSSDLQNSQNPFHVLEPKDSIQSPINTELEGGENMYNVLEPETNGEDTYNVLEPSDYGKDMYNVLKPENKSEDMYSVLDLENKNEDIYNVLEASEQGNGDDMYNVLETEKDSSTSSNIEDNEGENFYNILEPEADTQ